jgi:hypothetical protein
MTTAAAAARAEAAVVFTVHSNHTAVDREGPDRVTDLNHHRVVEIADHQDGWRVVGLGPEPSANRG